MFHFDGEELQPTTAIVNEWKDAAKGVAETKAKMSSLRQELESLQKEPAQEKVSIDLVDKVMFLADDLQQLDDKNFQFKMEMQMAEQELVSRIKRVGATSMTLSGEEGAPDEEFRLDGDGKLEYRNSI